MPRISLDLEPRHILRVRERLQHPQHCTDALDLLYCTVAGGVDRLDHQRRWEMSRVIPFHICRPRAHAHDAPHGRVPAAPDPSPGRVERAQHADAPNPERDHLQRTLRQNESGATVTDVRSTLDPWTARPTDPQPPR